MKHLENWQIAGFIEKTINVEEMESVKKHLSECPACKEDVKQMFTAYQEYLVCKNAGTLADFPEKLAENLKMPVLNPKKSIVDVLVDFAQKAGERAFAPLWQISDSLVPGMQPVYAMREKFDEVKPVDRGIELKRHFDRFEVMVRIIRSVSGNADIDIQVSDNTLNEMSAMRAGLFVESKQIDSTALKNGRADFSEISLGEYTLKIWDKSGDRIALSLSMKG